MWSHVPRYSSLLTIVPIAVRIQPFSVLPRLLIVWSLWLPAFIHNDNVTTMGNKNRKQPAEKNGAGRPAAGVLTAAPQRPNWPAFKPKLPVIPLVLDSPVPAFQDQILVIRGFWPKSLCRDFVAFLDRLPLTTTPGQPRRGDALRVNDRFQIEDPSFAQRLWLQTGLKELITKRSVQHLWGGEVIGLNPNIRVYRYSQGQFFDCHYDDSNMVDVPSADGSGNIRAKTTFTALLYLTSTAEGCLGGETVFHPHDRKLAQEEIAIPPETGMLLLHKHGEDCLLHEGREVLNGNKWVIRTDLCIHRQTV
ncbi:hypothetical protein F5Y16DRAFT_147465 [Xylariaceae sp. FL0255]|nr:hypothetical protein F5Y16DRAFT_147465 [Xylariaceae sp. FL0255]